MSRLTLCLTFAGLAWFGSVQDDALAEALYWVDSDGVHRSNLDGSGIRRIVADVSDPSGIAVDSIARKVYWTDELPTDNPDLGLAGRVMRANLDGSDMETLLELDVAPGAIGLRLDSEDRAGGEMYWLNRFPKEGLSSHGGGPGTIYLLNRNLWDIRRANLDGSDEQVLVTGLESGTDLAIDGTDGKLYWTGFSMRGLSGTVLRANLDGSQIETVLDRLGEFSARIALEPSAGKMYLGYRSTVHTLGDEGGGGWSVMMRSDLDGSEQEYFHSTEDYFLDLALDSAAGVIYWSDWTVTDSGTLSSAIHRVPVGSWEAETLVSGLQNANAIALGPTPIPEPSTLLMLGSGGFVLAALTRCRGKSKPAGDLRNRT